MGKELQFATKSECGNGAMNSWKEIAKHLGRSVRTVQRWEEHYGLPVRRFPGPYRTGVMAFVDEIDCWQRTATITRVSPVDNEPKLVLLENVDQNL